MSAHLPSDHAFSDHRIALSVAVVDWLDLLANGAGEAP
jgi:hypothetical protein